MVSFGLWRNTDPPSIDASSDGESTDEALPAGNTLPPSKDWIDSAILVDAAWVW